jgi:hypothetical protein
LFCITRFTFTSTTHFCFNLIKPLAFNLLTSKCEHGLDEFGMHLAHCPFGGQ